MWALNKYFYLFWILFYFLVTVTNVSLAQIKGVVHNSKNGKPIEGVTVFINHSTISAITNTDGVFELNPPFPGIFEFVLAKEHYRLYRSDMRVQLGRLYNLNLSLVPERRKKMTQDKGPLIQDNNYTGYRVIAYSENEIIRATRMEPMQADSLAQTIAWEKARKTSYEGSLTNFLRALNASRVREEGFTIQLNGKPVSNDAILQTTPEKTYSRLYSSSPLEIVYRTKFNAIAKSQLEFKGPVDFSKEGIPLNMNDLEVKGNMANKLNEGLPIDYVPIIGDVEKAYAETLKRLYEKVHIETDKPYYYQGEPLWFKAHLSYYYPQWKDSLSRVLYVELISSKRE